MKFCVLVSAVLAVACGQVTYPFGVVPMTVTSQHHAQDVLGQYHYGYSGPLSAKTEVKSLDGTTVGGYSYIDALGKLQNVQYTADAVHGFRVAASNLPVAPEMPKVEPLPMPKPIEESPEIIAARAKHMEAMKMAEKKAVEVPEISVPAIQHYMPVAQPYSYGVHTPMYSYGIATPYIHSMLPLPLYTKPIEPVKA